MMKFTCLQENLSKGLGIVCKATPTKSILPIYSNVLISAENGQIKLAATNTETTIITFIGASIEKEGAITVPAKILKEFVSTLSPSTLIAELKDAVLHISSEKTKSKFNGVDADDFPKLPQFDEKAKYIELDPKAFAAAVGNVAFAAATDEARPIFTGIYLHYVDGTLVVASSDGFRLSEKTLDMKSKMPEFSVVIPAKTLLEVSRIFANSVEPIKFVLNKEENLALFSSEDTLVASTILNGDYPDYRRIIPSEHILTAEFDAAELAEAIKLTNLFLTDSSNAIKLKFNPEGYIYIGSSGEEKGAHESQVTAIIEGDELEIAFNSKYLLDLLTNVKSEKISFKAKGNNSPCLFIPIGHENYVHVIAPMQVQK
jgi:DNA polymerase-3 subunit beta